MGQHHYIRNTVFQVFPAIGTFLKDLVKAKGGHGTRASFLERWHGGQRLMIGTISLLQ